MLPNITWSKWLLPVRRRSALIIPIARTVVLMDYTMARLNGATACRYILTEDPPARIVFVSSRPASELTDIGAVAILQKPVDLEELEELLNDMDAQLLFDYARYR